MTTQVTGSYSFIVSAPKFLEAIESAKNEGKQDDVDNGTFNAQDSNWFGAFVHSCSVEEYQRMTPILFDEGKAGFALKNGDIVSVFKHPKSNLSRALDAIIPLAIQLGGNRLDCFSRGLPAMYAKFGFSPVAKIQFDPECAPRDWNYARDGQPEIVFMVYKKTIIDRTQEEARTRIQRVQAEISQLNYSTYDEALRVQGISCELYSKRAS